MQTFFILGHLRLDKKQKISDEKQIGIYITRGDADYAKMEVSSQPGFKDFPEGFFIKEIILDEVYFEKGFNPNKWMYF